jgi:UDP-N-acetylmuramoyl-L-alanyl-D-glutamate--2,6-diaminopimelate ligase
MKGTSTDGARYISEAMRMGASLVFTDVPQKEPSSSVLYIRDLRRKAPQLLNTFHRNPVENLLCIGVTGTNGKTTVVRLTSSIFEQAGHSIISLGTIDNRLAGEVMPSRLTTPDPVELMDLIRRGVQKGCNVLIMEVSSHALDQDRVSAIPFNRALFTNLTRDHMDYHRDFEEYFQAKKKLFTQFMDKKGIAVINADSDYGRRLMHELSCPIVSFSQSNRKEAGPDIDLTLEHKKLSLEKTDLAVHYKGKEHAFTSNLFGNINLENLMAVIALGFSLDIAPDSIDRGICDVQVSGRNEVFSLPGGAVAVVDYAHTPDALERVLLSMRSVLNGKVVCVFGCGGDRDRSKRSEMGRITQELSDIAIVTNDNPRLEDPEVIIGDILAGMKHPDKVEIYPDRAVAIKKCLDRLEPGDCGIIAGKGHEDYQINGAEKSHFSDREQIEKWIREHK